MCRLYHIPENKVKLPKKPAENKLYDSAWRRGSDMLNGGINEIRNRTATPASRPLLAPPFVQVRINVQANVAILPEIFRRPWANRLYLMINGCAKKEGRGFEKVSVLISDQKISRNIESDPEDAVAATCSTVLCHRIEKGVLMIDVDRKGIEEEAGGDKLLLEAMAAFGLAFSYLEERFPGRFGTMRANSCRSVTEHSFSAMYGAYEPVFKQFMCLKIMSDIFDNDQRPIVRLAQKYLERLSTAVLKDYLQCWPARNGRKARGEAFKNLLNSVTVAIMYASFPIAYLYGHVESRVADAVYASFVGQLRAKMGTQWGQIIEGQIKRWIDSRVYEGLLEGRLPSMEGYIEMENITIAMAVAACRAVGERTDLYLASKGMR